MTKTLDELMALAFEIADRSKLIGRQEGLFNGKEPWSEQEFRARVSFEESNYHDREKLRVALRELIADAEELRLRKKSGSASDRLHNICRAVEEEADNSVFSREEWERIDAENVELRKRLKWQPIETVPRDGSAVLVWLAEPMLGTHVHSASYHPNVDRVGGVFAFDAPKALFWMPLPEPPCTTS